MVQQQNVIKQVKGRQGRKQEIILSQEIAVIKGKAKEATGQQVIKV